MATYTSVQNGNWNDPATWGSASYPSVAGDIVNIIHEVIYNVNSAVQMGDIIVKGNTGILRFSKIMNTRLALQHKNLVIGDDTTTGKFIIGESDEECLPKEYTAILEFATTSDNVKGIVLSNAWPLAQQISLHGDSSLYGNVLSATLLSDWASGTTFTVIGDLTNKWRIGQKLIIQNVEDYPPDGTAYNVAKKLKILTISNIVLNGSNTDITVSEAWANTFWANAIVTNLTRNIIIRKVNAVTTLGGWNTARPMLDGSYGYTYTNSINEINNVDFTGFYTIKGIYCLFKNCVFRNGYFGLQDLALCYSITDYEMSVVEYKENNVKESIFFSMYYPFSDGGGQFTHISDSQFVGNLYCFNNDGNKKITNCKFIANNIASFSCRHMKFYDCDFIQNGYSVYRSTNMDYYNCMFYKQNRLCNRGGPYLFKSCYHGCDRNEVLEAAFWDRYGEMHNLYGSDLSFDDCVGGFWVYGPDAGYTECKLRNTRNLDTWDPYDDTIVMDAECGVFDEDGNGRIKDIYYCKRVSDSYIGIDSQKFHVYKRVPFSKFSNLVTLTENNVKPIPQKRKFYIKTENFISWTANNLYMEVEYLSNNTSWVTAKIQSIQVPSANNVWTELSVEFTPAREGDAVYRIILTGFPEISITYTWREDWQWWEIIYSNPWIYIDSAIWISDTQYVKIPWAIGDWEPRFTSPDMPLSIDVRADTVYNDGQSTGSLIIPFPEYHGQKIETDLGLEQPKLEIKIT
jgi:hypothetical protein